MEHPFGQPYYVKKVYFFYVCLQRSLARVKALHFKDTFLNPEAYARPLPCFTYDDRLILCQQTLIGHRGLVVIKARERCEQEEFYFSPKTWSEHRLQCVDVSSERMEVV